MEIYVFNQLDLLSKLITLRDKAILLSVYEDQKEGMQFALYQLNDFYIVTSVPSNSTQFISIKSSKSKDLLFKFLDKVDFNLVDVYTNFNL